MHLSLLSSSCLSEHRYLSSYPRIPLPFLNPYSSTPIGNAPLCRVFIQRLPCHLARCSSQVLLTGCQFYSSSSTSRVMQKTNTTFVFRFPSCLRKTKKDYKQTIVVFPMNVRNKTKNGTTNCVSRLLLSWVYHFRLFTILQTLC